MFECTKTRTQLAAIYTEADVLFNPTYEDNYPTVNLESEACGTPVITYDTGGCKETVRNSKSIVVKNYAEGLNMLRMIHINNK